MKKHLSKETRMIGALMANILVFLTEGWLFAWRVVVCMEGGCLHGGWLFAWRVVVCMEGGCLHGGWLFAWRVVVCMEGGCLHGGWVFTEQLFYDSPFPPPATPRNNS